MKFTSWTILILLFFISCQRNKEITPSNTINWKERRALITNSDSLIHGSSYLSLYSQIYQLHEKKIDDLTVTVSLRNISQKDTVYISSANYYNTTGEKIRTYFDKPIYLTPLETVEIVIDESDNEGGTGGNFIFEWAVKNEANPPLFEAVMISTAGQQGLSFLTRGIRLYE